MLSSRSRTRLIAAVALVGALVAGFAVARSGELSPGAHVTVLITGAVVVGVGLARRTGAGSPPVGRRGVPWFGWLTLVLVWEALALAADDVPTISDLLDPVLARSAVRATATVGWLAVGAWLATRPGARSGAAMRTTTGRVVVLTAWLWVGLHFLAR